MYVEDKVFQGRHCAHMCIIYVYKCMKHSDTIYTQYMCRMYSILIRAQNVHVCVYIWIHYWYLVPLVQYSTDVLQIGGTCLTALSGQRTSGLSCVLHVEDFRNYIFGFSENKKI